MINLRLSSKKVLAMDFGSRSIKMVEGVYKKEHLNIERTLLLDLPQGLYEDGYIKDSHILEDIIRSFLRLNSIKSMDTIGLVSSSDILTRDVVIPNVTEEEVEGILKYKISDYIPIEPEDYIVQYINEGVFIEGGNEFIKLFIIAMPKLIAKEHFELFKNLDLKPKVLDIQSNAIKKLLIYNNENGNNTKDKTIALLDIGFESTKLTIIKDEKIEVSRIVPLAVKDLLDDLYISTNVSERELLYSIFHINDIDLQAEEIVQIDKSLSSFLSRLFESIDMIFRYFISQEEENEIDLIVLQGSIANNPTISEKLENYLNIKTLNMNSFKNILDKDLHLYSNAIGSLIRGDVK